MATLTTLPNGRCRSFHVHATESIWPDNERSYRCTSSIRHATYRPRVDLSDWCRNTFGKKVKSDEHQKAKRSVVCKNTRTVQLSLGRFRASRCRKKFKLHLTVSNRIDRYCAGWRTRAERLVFLWDGSATSTQGNDSMHCSWDAWRV